PVASWIYACARTGTPPSSWLRLCRRTWRKGYAFPMRLITYSRLRLELGGRAANLKKGATVSQRLTAMCGGQAASSIGGHGSTKQSKGYHPLCGFFVLPIA